MSVRQWVGAYFLLQGVAVILWWLLLFLMPSSRAYFRMGADSDAILLAFWFPDLILLALGSLVGSWLSFRGDTLALYVLWVVCGAISYATLYCLVFALMTNTGWLGVALMLPAMLLSISSTLAVSPLTVGLLRQAAPASSKWNLTKTLTQIILFWGVLLFLVPYLVLLIQERVGLNRFSFSLQHALALVLFVCLSALGLWSGITMARRGNGTPLPLDSPRQLVVSGPYSYVRNPMAIAGLGQGVAVGLWMGSAFVLVYVLIGGWIWQCLTRPLEEEDMLRHFGTAYEVYRREVRCWRPRLKAYKD